MARCVSIEDSERECSVPPDKCLHDRLREIRARLEQYPAANLVFIVHGGLVPRETSIEDAVEISQAMWRDESCAPHSKGASARCYFPVSIVWRSGAIETYREQLLEINQGERKPLFARVTAPLGLATDLARGIVQMPLFGAREGIATLGKRCPRSLAWRRSEIFLRAYG